MKNKILFIFISVFVFIFGLNKVGAYTLYEDNDYGVFDEKKIYDILIEKEPEFDIEVYKYVYCLSQENNLSVECNFFRDVSRFPSGTGSNSVSISNLYYYNIKLYFQSGNYTEEYHKNFGNTLFYYTSYYGMTYDINSKKKYGNINSYSNFDINYTDNNGKSTLNVLDFSHVLDSEEPTQEGLSILSVATENFNNILSKASDICSYLFTQELFLMGLSVVLFYVSFLIIHRFMR